VDLPTEIRVVAYRIVQEAMVNVRKHAAASQVVVTVRERNGGVEIEVTDDGRGFDPDRVDKRPGHLGLAGMRERAALVGADLVVESASGGGTLVRLWVSKPTRAGNGDD
jgi:signal transduction histidine kinase